jgi:hypothetical protein
MSRLPNPNAYPNDNLPKEKQFTYIYNTASYTVQQNQDIPLDNTGPSTNKIIHNYGSSVVIIKQPGLYKITYVILSESSNNQVAIAINNRVQYDTLYGASDMYQNYGNAILYLREGDVLSLRNIGGELTTPSNTFDNFNVINASLILETMNFGEC